MGGSIDHGNVSKSNVEFEAGCLLEPIFRDVFEFLPVRDLECFYTREILTATHDSIKAIINKHPKVL